MKDCSNSPVVCSLNYAELNTNFKFISNLDLVDNDTTKRVPRFRSVTWNGLSFLMFIDFLGELNVKH